MTLEKESSQIQSFRNIPRLFKMIWEISPRLTLICVLLRVAQAIVPVSILYIGKEIVDEVIRLAAIEKVIHDLELLQTLAFWIVSGLILTILMNVLNRYIALAENLLSDLVINANSIQIMHHATKMELYQFEDAKFYDTLNIARSQTGNRTALMGLVLNQLQDTVTVAALIVALIAFSPWLVIILILAVVPAFYGELYFNKKLYSLIYSHTPERRQLDYLRFIGSSDQTIKEIKVFGLEQFITDRFAGISERYYQEKKKIALKRTFFGSLFSIIGTTAYYSAYVFVLYQTVAGIITTGTMIFLGGAFQHMQKLLQHTVSRFAQINNIALYLQDYFDFLDIEVPTNEYLSDQVLPKYIQTGFVFENVSFKYAGSDKFVLRNLCFTLKAGEKLALVGENGAGKTTLVKLLARLYIPVEGRILLDGVDIQQYSAKKYREMIGVIFQDYIRFFFTVRENIAVGDITKLANDKLIKIAAEKSLADTVISELEHQYDQMLGKRFEDGVELSGGQWQKIALARAYMRESQLIILDEPTAALDALAEHEVFLRFSELTKGKTAVLISHRFSTVRMADKILFLENGRKLEFGSHEELLQQKGKYAELFNLQARGYI